MQIHEWLSKKRKLRNIPPGERIEKLRALLKRAKHRRVLLDILFEIRLARYLIYIRKLKPWRAGDIKTPENEEELADLLKEEEIEIEPETLEEELSLPPPKEEEAIGKIYSAAEEEDIYTGKGYKGSREDTDYTGGKDESKHYKTKKHAAGFFGERVSKEEEHRMTAADRVTRETREDIKYERDVKKSKKKGY